MSLTWLKEQQNSSCRSGNLDLDTIDVACLPYNIRQLRRSINKQHLHQAYLEEEFPHASDVLAGPRHACGISCILISTGSKPCGKPAYNTSSKLNKKPAGQTNPFNSVISHAISAHALSY